MPRLLLLNHVILLLCASIYLGTGISLALFQFPLESAPRFFSYMTVLMLICALIMLATEWLSGLRWVPVVVLLAIIAAAVLGHFAIAPLGHLNRARISLWVIQWAAMAYWFYRMALQARADR
jgi:hypothetical protein